MLAGMTHMMTSQSTWNEKHARESMPQKRMELTVSIGVLLK